VLKWCLEVMSKHMNFSLMPFFVLTSNDLIASAARFDSIIQCMNLIKIFL
jgi:hypothetical protein